MTLAELLREARAALAGSETAAIDARLLVGHLGGFTQSDMIARPDRPVDAEQERTVRAAVLRRVAGEPVHRILGFREFYGLRLGLSPDTLEPRPDTETLVEAILPFVRATADRLGACRILDLGTGTGAIALALLSAEARAHATATDIAPGALAQAQENARSLGLDGRFNAVRSDWFAGVDGHFHAIVSNPPYIAGKELPALQREVRDFDPHRALDGGEDGLDAYRSIAAGAGRHLDADGRIAVEIGKGQADDVIALFREAGYRPVLRSADLGGTERVIVVQRQGCIVAGQK